MIRLRGHLEMFKKKDEEEII